MTISLQCKGDPLNLAEAYLTLHNPEGIVQSYSYICSTISDTKKLFIDV